MELTYPTNTHKKKEDHRLESAKKKRDICPIESMYGIFTYIYHKNQPNVGIYTIHGSYGAHEFRTGHGSRML